MNIKQRIITTANALRERYAAWRAASKVRNTELGRLLAATEDSSLIWRREHVGMYSTFDGTFQIDVDTTSGRVLMHDDEIVRAFELGGRHGTPLTYAIVRSAHPGITETDLIRIV